MAADLSATVQNGYALLNSGLLDQAAAAFQQALTQAPDDPGALSGMAAVRNAEGNLGDALEWSERALSREPRNSDLLLRHAQYQVMANRPDDARKTLSSAKAANLRDVLSLYNLGILLLMLDDPTEAKKSLFRANKLEPGNADVLYALGAANAELGDITQAEKSFEHCLAVSPAHAGPVHLQLGNLYFRQRRLEKAAEHLDAAVSADPSNSEALVSLSAARFRQGDTDGAVDASRRALSLEPDDAAIRINLARYLSVQGDLAGAIKETSQAFDLAPVDSDIGGTLYQFLRQACQWAETAPLSARLNELLEAANNGGPVYRELPFVNVFRVAEGRNNLDVARHRIHRVAPGIPTDGYKREFEKRRRQWAKTAGQPVRIAYISSDFRDHPTAHLMRNFFALHDRTRFHVSAYSHGPDDSSDYRDTIQAGCDAFHDIANLSDKAAADRIAGDGVDILIDLNVHITGERMEICAHRPAPVQISMLAFPGTSGADFYDYLIGDEVVTPANEQAHFSEHIIYMPATYFLTNHAEVVAETGPDRATEGLPEDGIVFACFNNAYKIEPDLFAAWMGILTAVPDSVFWLFSKSVLVQDNLRQAAANAGVDGQRLIFAGDLPKAAHLARLKCADLALDTGIYGGHTTTADALRVGVPVITTAGTHYASRASSSIIRAMGLNELVCDNLAAYGNLACALAKDPDRLKALKSTVAANLDTQPLFDGPFYARHLEAGLLEAHRLWRDGQAPAHIRTAELL